MLKTEDKLLLKTLNQKRLFPKSTRNKILLDIEEKQNQNGITKILLNHLNIDEEYLAQFLAHLFNMPFLNNINTLGAIKLSGVSYEDLIKNRVIPIIFESDEVTVAFTDPPYANLVNLLEKTFDKHVIPVMVTVSDFDSLRNLTNDQINSKSSPPSLNIPGTEPNFQSDQTTENLLPAPNLISKVLEFAISHQASDIHFEINKDNLLNVRVRMDGVIQKVGTLPQQYTNSILSIIKQNGTIDAFNRRNIQEGKATFKVRGQNIHTRINVIPTLYGEKLTIRLWDQTLQFREITEIGLSNHDFNRILEMLHPEEEIILFAGPGGSGKTSTMYAVLKKLKDKSKNIATIENPVEYLIEGISQTHAGDHLPISTVDGIRSLLHHDVDIMGIGEIRSKEEAELLVEAGLTGIQAVATIQASDAIKTLFRLQHFGLPMEDIAMVIKGIIAQKFVRKICQDCKEKYKPEQDLLHKIGLMNLPQQFEFVRGKGCPSCKFTGYKDRLPLFETFLLDDTMKGLLHTDSNYNTVKTFAIKNGYSTMRYDGLRKVLAGMTSINEVLRVT